MKNKFSLDNPMPPIWMMYPHISQYSIGWRMGYGEGYKFELFDWLETMTKEEQENFNEMFPDPIFWRDFYSEDEGDFYEEEVDNYSYGMISFWEKHGEPKYSIEKLMNSDTDLNLEYIFFWKSNSTEIDKSCLGRWQISDFEVDIDDYCCAEQYMMAEKASLFEDKETKEQIMQTSDPREMQALGRKIKNFEQHIWDKVKYSIVLHANYYKFTQNKEMRDFLLSTGNKILVEASPLDKIWGIGLEENNLKVHNPKTWNGKNLLGFALMEVRDELRRLYKNYHKIDWESLKEYD